MTVHIECKREECRNTIEADESNDTVRCGACGKEHDVPDAPAETGPSASVTADGEDIHIHLHIHRDGSA